MTLICKEIHDLKNKPNDYKPNDPDDLIDWSNYIEFSKKILK